MASNRSFAEIAASSRGRRELLEEVGPRVLLEAGFNLEAKEEKAELAFGAYTVPVIPAKMKPEYLHENGTLYSDHQLKITQAYKSSPNDQEEKNVEGIIGEYVARLDTNKKEDLLDNLSKISDFIIIYKLLLLKLNEIVIPENLRDEEKLKKDKGLQQQRNDFEKDKFAIYFKHFNKVFTGINEALNLPLTEIELKRYKVKSLSDVLQLRIAEVLETSIKQIKSEFPDIEKKFNDLDDNDGIPENIDECFDELIAIDEKITGLRRNVFSTFCESLGNIIEKVSILKEAEGEVEKISPTEEQEKIAEKSMAAAKWDPEKTLHNGRNTKFQLSTLVGLENGKTLSYIRNKDSKDQIIAPGKSNGGISLGSGSFGSVKFTQTVSPEHEFNAIKIQKKRSAAEADKVEEEEKQLEEVGMRVYGYTRKSQRETGMPLFEGKPFSDINTKLSDFACSQVVLNTLIAVQKIHQQNKLHLDIKSDNLLFDLHQLESNQAAHLIDFGLSLNLKEGEENISGTFKGTMLYMAPEVLGSESSSLSYNKAVDVYALGMSLAQFFGMTEKNKIYNGVSGEYPIISKAKEELAAGNKDVGLLKLSEENQIRNPKGLTPEMQKGFYELFKKMTDPDQTKRPALDSCVKELKNLTLFKEAKPNILVVNFETLKNIKFSSKDIETEIRKNELNRYDQVVIVGDTDISIKEYSKMLHSLARSGISNLSSTILVADPKIENHPQQLLEERFTRGIVLTKLLSVDKNGKLEFANSSTANVEEKIESKLEPIAESDSYKSLDIGGSIGDLEETSSIKSIPEIPSVARFGMFKVPASNSKVASVEDELKKEINNPPSVTVSNKGP